MTTAAASTQHSPSRAADADARTRPSIAEVGGPDPLGLAADLFGSFDRRVRLSTLILLRWLAVAGQTATIVATELVLDFDTPLALALGVISASAWVNIFLSVAQPVNKILSDAEAGAQLAFDLVQLALLVMFTGGLANPFVALLAAPVVIGFAVLRTPYAILLASLAVGLTLLMAGWSLPLPWTRGGEPYAPPAAYIAGIWFAFVTGAGFMSVFVWRGAEDARRMSTALAASQIVLAREQRLSALGGLAAAAAHELGTPLGTIQVIARELKQQAAPGSDLAEDADLLLSQATRCRDILSQLSRRGAENDAVHAQLSLRQMVEEVVEPLRALGKRFDLEYEPPHGQSWPGARTPKLRRMPEILYALSNYVENANDFSRERVTVTSRWGETFVEVEVRDDGPGFPPEVLARLGEPYVTRRSAETPNRGGMGLGFFIAKTFVERTGGAVEFGNVKPPATGAVVRVRWPLARIRAESG